LEGADDGAPESVLVVGDDVVVGEGDEDGVAAGGVQELTGFVAFRRQHLEEDQRLLRGILSLDEGNRSEIKYLKPFQSW
jgi:hypothetical protein